MKSTKTTVRLARSIRKVWVINPRSRIHSDKKGVYNRFDTRKAERDWQYA